MKYLAQFLGLGKHYMCLLFIAAFGVDIIRITIPTLEMRKLQSQDYVQFVRAAVTKCLKLGGLHNRNLLSHSSGGQKSKSSLSAGLVPSMKENQFHASLPASGGFCRSLVFLGLQMLHPDLQLYLDMAFSLCMCFCLQISPFHKENSRIRSPSYSSKISS